MLTKQKRGRPPGGRKDEILELFTQYVAERGYDGTNFGDLADELGVSKGTIVHHFGTKERMLEEQHAQYMRRRLAEARVILESLDRPPEQLAAFIHLFVLCHRDDRAPTVAFARELVRFSSDAVMQRVVELREEYVAMVRGVVQRGMDAGDFRPGDAALAALQILGSCSWAWTWFKPGGRCSAEEVAASFTDVFLSGLLSSPPLDPATLAPDGPVLRAVRAAIAAGRPGRPAGEAAGTAAGGDDGGPAAG